MKIFIDFWASFYHASLSKFELSPNMSNFQAVLQTGGQLKVSRSSPLSPADNLMELGEYFKKVAPPLTVKMGGATKNDYF